MPYIFCYDRTINKLSLRFVSSSDDIVDNILFIKKIKKYINVIEILDVNGRMKSDDDKRIILGLLVFMYSNTIKSLLLNEDVIHVETLADVVNDAVSLQRIELYSRDCSWRPSHLF